MSYPSTPPAKYADNSPASRKTSQNYHPYMIQSTSSSLLTRSNSSPAQPLDSPSRHRPSRSMSSLSSQALTPGGEEKEDRRRSLEAGRPSYLKRSGTLPAFPPSPSDFKKLQITLPGNPKLWTPSELATYLVHTLTTGGDDGDGHALPTVLVEDIRSWVLRQQLNGRAFLRGGEQGWGNSQRPPPFLPLLLSLSRKLRRAALQGRILTDRRNSSMRGSVGSADAMSPSSDFANFRTSTVVEEGEGSDDDDRGLEDEDQILGVKKLVKDFDMRGSASEASEVSGDEDVVRRASFTTEWRKDIGVAGRRRRDSVMSAGGLADGEMSPSIGARVHALQAQLTGGSQGGLDQRHSQLDARPAIGPSGSSPPPPYASPNPDNGEHQSPSPRGLDPEMLHVDASPAGRARASPSPTPTPPRPKPSTAQTDFTDGFSVPEESPHMTNMQTHERLGSNPYFALRRSTSSSGSGQGPRLPTLASLRENAEQAMKEISGTDDERRRSTPSRGAQAWDMGSVDGDDARWTTARRVTLRPNPAKGLFEAAGSASSPEGTRVGGESKREKRATEEDMEQKMSQLHARIRELEERLQSVEEEKKLAKPTGTLLQSLGLGSGGDGLPSGIKGLPAYLFLVGIGVGVVVVKVLLGKRR